jgi:hypothetical protein
MVHDSIGSGQRRRGEFVRARQPSRISDFIEALGEMARASSRQFAVRAKFTAFIQLAFVACFILVNVLFWREVIGAFEGMKFVGDPHSVACRSVASESIKLDEKPPGCP